MDRRPRQRLDKWLWHARFGRTRTLAAKSVQAGNIRLNKVKIIKPSHCVTTGDILTIYTGGEIRVIRVTGMADRRVSPSMVAGLYEDITVPRGPEADLLHGQGSYGQPQSGWAAGDAHSTL